MKALLILIIFLCASLTQASPKKIPVLIKESLAPEKSTVVKVTKALDGAQYLLVESKKDAEKYFSAKDLKSLSFVDFSKRKLVVFAWKGSGGDEIKPNIMESYPEQISFSLNRGLTRDLRQHFVVFSIRGNVVLK